MSNNNFLIAVLFDMRIDEISLYEMLIFNCQVLDAGNIALSPQTAIVNISYHLWIFWFSFWKRIIHFHQISNKTIVGLLTGTTWDLLF